MAHFRCRAHPVKHQTSKRPPGGGAGRLRENRADRLRGRGKRLGGVRERAGAPSLFGRRGSFEPEILGHGEQSLCKRPDRFPARAGCGTLALPVAGCSCPKRPHDLSRSYFSLQVARRRMGGHGAFPARNGTESFWHKIVASHHTWILSLIL